MTTDEIIQKTFERLQRDLWLTGPPRIPLVYPWWKRWMWWLPKEQWGYDPRYALPSSHGTTHIRISKPARDAP